MTARLQQQRRIVAQQRFLDFYPDGFRDADYVALERQYKWDAHRRWSEQLDRRSFAERLRAGEYEALARDIVRIETATNLLFSFEKIAIRDAISTPAGAKTFTEALFDWLHGTGARSTRFMRWRAALEDLPRRQTRVATWPVATTFGFLARPKLHLMLKPMVTRRAATTYGYDLRYRPQLQWSTNASVLEFARVLRDDLAGWGPRDMIDVQSFIWVLGSDEYD